MRKFKRKILTIANVILLLRVSFQVAIEVRLRSKFVLAFGAFVVADVVVDLDVGRERAVVEEGLAAPDHK